MKKSVLLILLYIISFPCFSQFQDYTVTIYDSTQVSGYYFLSGPVNGKISLVILDKNGDIVCYKPLARGAVNSNFNLEANGSLSYAEMRRYLILDSTFRTRDTLKCKNIFQTDTHDKLPLPNGHILLLGEEHFTIDLKKYPFLKQKFGFDSLGVMAGVIQEQDAKHRVVFEWHAREHFDFDDVDTFLYNRDKDGPWTHCNALTLDSDGNILLSSRNFDEITKINRSDGSIMWRWGGRCNEFKFINCPVPFYGQHDIRRLPNGHFTLFDNGENTVSHGARAMEFELDETNKIATLVWSYTYDPAMSSNGQGNVQRFDDSKTLVNFGRISCDSVCFVVIDSTGSKIFQVNGFNTYRVYYYPSLPWKLPRPKITYRDSAGVSYLEAEPGFKSYAWSDGSKQRIIVAKHGIAYSVFVPYGDGAYISSERIVVKN